MKHLFITLLLLMGIGSSAFAQEKSRKEIKGDKYYFVYSFDKAIDCYTHAKQLTTEGQRKLAASYHNMGQNVQAEEAYSKLTSTSDGVIPEDYYNFAMVLKKNGKYDASNIWMDKFKQVKPEDLRAIDYAANNSRFGELSKDDGKYSIEPLNFNTDAQDFGASYFNQQIVFSSTRAFPKMIKRESNWNGKPYLNMYVSDLSNGQMSDPEVFNKKFNGKMHEGPASFSNNGTFMAYTRNNYDTEKKNRVVSLQIFFSKFADGKWSKPEPFKLNDQNYSVGHPCLTADGNTMYFTSDMPGGFGGADIYRIKKDDKGDWGTPENLGKTINTEGDEVFPFYEEKNEVLFYSSNGRYGLGGLDVFICAMNGDEIGHSYNAGAPLNTSADDFGVVVDNDLKKGFVSSNRSGGKGDDDIYSFTILKGLDIDKKLKGIAKDKNGNAIPSTLISLFDEKGDVLKTLTTKEDGAFTFLVEQNKNFKLTGKKESYMDGENTANTFGKENVVTADVVLLQKEIIVATIIPVGTDIGKAAKLETIHFDLDKYDIRPDAERELDKIVKIMNDNPNMVVQLSSYTDCRASAEYNQTLSENRAKSTLDYIKHRITNPERISGKGYGKTHLLNGCDCDGDAAANCPDTDHEKNRRTEFIVIKN